jgi:hypothetical protein
MQAAPIGNVSEEEKMNQTGIRKAGGLFTWACISCYSHNSPARRSQQRSPKREQYIYNTLINLVRLVISLNEKKNKR